MPLHSIGTYHIETSDAFPRFPFATFAYPQTSRPIAIGWLFGYNHDAMIPEILQSDRYSGVWEMGFYETGLGDGF